MGIHNRHAINHSWPQCTLHERARHTSGWLELLATSQGLAPPLRQPALSGMVLFDEEEELLWKPLPRSVLPTVSKCNHRKSATFTRAPA